MLYFAYGSNMDWPRMRERCPAAQFVCKSLLPDYELQFTRTSKRLKCGTADILAAPGKSVWGVVYHINLEDRQKLDRLEGVSVGAYQHQNLKVYSEGDLKRPLRISTYIVSAKESPPPKPSRAYLQHLLDGATKWGLPQPYIKALQSIETLPPSALENAKTLAREVGSQIIKENPELWEELKEQLRGGYDVGIYGSVCHMNFLDAVGNAIAKLSEGERRLLNTIPRPSDAIETWTVQDYINGDIFHRAKRGVSGV